MRILVIEDEPAIADFIQRGLAAEGYEVEAVNDGEQGLERALASEFSLLILDRMLPGLDGMEVLDVLRARRPELPVILLTARDGVSHRVEGLDAGAVDYVTKPFEFEELAARVRAQLRSPLAGASTRLNAFGIELDLLRRRMRRDGVEIALSSTEFDLLAHFLRHPGNVLTREHLLNAVWGYEHDPGTNILEVYVSYLRRKLQRTGSPAPIVTVRSVGYKLAQSGG